MSLNLSAADGLVPGFGAQKSDTAKDIFSALRDEKNAAEFRLAGAALDAGAQREFDKIQLEIMKKGMQPQKSAGGFDWMGLAKTGLGALASGGFGGGGGGGGFTPTSGWDDLGSGFGGFGAGAGDIDFAGVDSGVLNSVVGNAGQYLGG